MKGEISMTKQTPIFTKGTLYQITCADLQTDPNQPRKYFDPAAQQDLVNSFQKQGVLQPILFHVDKDGIPFIVAGERRLQAAKKAGMKTIPAILVEGNYSEIALVENLLREDLTAIELAEALDRIMKDQNYTQDQLTTIIGKAKSTVSEILCLNHLPDEIRDECRNNPLISRKTLIEISKKKKPKGMLTAYKKYQERISSPKKTRGQKGKRKSWIDRFASKYDALTAFVADMDLGTLDTPARNDLISRIKELKKTAESLIAQIQSMPVKETAPTKIPVRKKITKGQTRPALATPKPEKAKEGKKRPIIKIKK